MDGPEIEIHFLLWFINPGKCVFHPLHIIAIGEIFTRMGAADDLLQGGSAIKITSNVSKGLVLDAPPTDTAP